MVYAVKLQVNFNSVIRLTIYLQQMFFLVDTFHTKRLLLAKNEADERVAWVQKYVKHVSDGLAIIFKMPSTWTWRNRDK